MERSGTGRSPQLATQCRCCLTISPAQRSVDEVPSVGDRPATVTLRHMMDIFVGLEFMSADRRQSDHICVQCANQLTGAHEFYRVCVRAQGSLLDAATHIHHPKRPKPTATTKVVPPVEIHERQADSLSVKSECTPQIASLLDDSESSTDSINDQQCTPRTVSPLDPPECKGKRKRVKPCMPQTADNMSVQRRSLRTASPLDLPDDCFFKTYRMPKEVFLEVFKDVADLLPVGARSTRLPPMLRFSVSIAFYASGDYQSKVCHTTISQKAASTSIIEVTNALEESLCQKWIRFPKTTSAREQIRQQFAAAFGVPGVIGCVDGMRVLIVAPRASEQLYADGLKHSINVQLVCDNELNILSVDAKHPGSSRDASIWRKSSVRRYLENLHSTSAEEEWLLGDSGYPLEPWLITPFWGSAEDTPETRFNAMHKKLRHCVQRTTDVLKMRWRCLLGERALRYHPERVMQFTNVCCALHNVCVKRRVPLAPIDDSCAATDKNVLPESIQIIQNISLHNIGAENRQRLLAHIG